MLTPSSFPFFHNLLPPLLTAGFVFSGKAGSGLVIARLPDGSWSAPSCIATAGLGWGFQAGAGESRFSPALKPF